MHTLPNYPGLNVLLILLSLLCYMMWDGRGMDNYGRSWIELHVVLLLSALAGAGLRVYAQLRPEARERTVGYSALLFLGLVFLGDNLNALARAEHSLGKGRTNLQPPDNNQ